MGIYSSNLSCWQRRKLGLPQDHAGPTEINSETKKVPVDGVEKESPRIDSEATVEKLDEVVEKPGKVIGEVVERPGVVIGESTKRSKRK